MKAAPGDRIIIKGHHIGQPDRDAEILEVRGDDGHEGFFFPGSDAQIHHFEHPKA